MIEVQRIESNGWVIGRVGEYRFQALIFREHAADPAWELARSKISKLWIQHDGRSVFNWDRGLDVDAQSEEVQDVVVRLCSELDAMLPYRPGDRIRLLAMDDIDPVPAGSLGTVGAVRFLDGWMQIDVDWDNGRSLMLSVPPDRVASVDC